jgi:hypothetical protein
MLKCDHLIFDTLLGLSREVHYSQKLELYRTENGHCWTIGPHHLLVPSFMMAFERERQGDHPRMGFELDGVFAAAASSLFYVSPTVPAS